MSEFPYDSAIVAAIISVGISVIMYAIAEKKIEPKKWKKNIELSTLEKQLEAYGILVTLLQALRQKARRDGYNNQEQKDHLMELPEDIQIRRHI